jgi:hypothetical protein
VRHNQARIAQSAVAMQEKSEMKMLQGRVRRGQSVWGVALVTLSLGAALLLLPGCPGVMGECTTDADCTAEGTPVCLVDAENPANNQCVQCLSDADCSQGVCAQGQGYVCIECIADSDCDDGDPCTTDVCNAATCTFTPVECGEGEVCLEGECLPDEDVIVTASIEGDAIPGGSLTATADVTIRDGSTIESYSWTQSNSVTVGITDPTGESTSVSLPNAGAYKDELLSVLAEPPIGEEDLPPNVPLPEGEFPGGLQDRFHVVGLNPFSLEETGLVVLEVAVTTTSGTYTGEVEIHTELPWPVAPGILNVPLSRAVLLYRKTQAAYD